ncbi:/ / Basic membrane protein / 612359:614026 Reverse [Candidatus Hepatoplasma crinochetorum]|uniref:/ / Basic membrane protein / 612359:614026 Reverse n=1 Tax=Candidatus Hepatoplasma crinochetorum TaxID=295596 RepID=A0A0G7ZLT2_9MOLU|nr:/ / Basic membrane protein / 612359:614026 Reverse [Candidatus Hepatoplasma crinochetorum]
MKKWILNYRKSFITIISLILVIFLVMLLFFTGFFIDYKTGVTPGFQRIMVMPNSPFKNDRGFNQNMIEATIKYGEDFDEDIGEVVPNEIDNTVEYQKNISYSYDNGAKIITSAGYNVLDALLGTSNYSNSTRLDDGLMFNSKYKDDWFLLIDDANYDSRIARNVISFRFESEQAGFIAGLAASIYITALDDSDINNVSTYGGLQFSTVFDFMSGYEQAINWFNYQVLGYDLEHNKVNQDAFLYDSSYSSDYVHLINQYGNEPNYSSSTTQKNTADWYSGSFNVGDGRTITTRLIDNKTKVIFPVNGGQMVDTITLVESENETNKSSDYKVIGVDVDATKQFPGSDDSVLGSATKNIQEAANIGLWYIDKFILTYNQDDDFLNNPDYDVKNPQLEEEYYNSISKDKDDGGWKESNQDYIDSDLATKTDQEIDQYLKDPNSDLFYIDGVDSSYYYTDQDPLIYGSIFVGNYQNNGLDFVDSDALNDSFAKLLIEFNPNLLDYDFFDFVSYAIEQQPIDQSGNIIIEKASNTFSDEYSNPITAGYYLLYPWIPNWSVYSK